MQSTALQRMLGEANIVQRSKDHLKGVVLTTTESAGADTLSDGREPKVVIVVLNWNGKRVTAKCFESLKAIDYSNYEILLVDNGSTDGSQQYFRAQYPEIVLLENEVNLGFAEGNNVGIRHAMNGRADYVLLLNNDTLVHAKFLSELVHVAERDSSIGFVGPKIYYRDWHGQRDVIAFAGGCVNLWIGKARNIGEGEKERGQYEEIKEVSYLQGSCLLVKREVVQRVGLLDSTLFAYWEETDWCMRGRHAGYASVFVPSAKIWHEVAASTGGVRSRYYLTRNLFWFMKKRATRKQYLSFLLYFFFVQFWISTGRIIGSSKSRGQFLSFLRGVRDGVANRSRDFH
jgi:GT2 family glycosyltransferase